MKQNTKNYNFCDFNFNQRKSCVSKNELSVFEHFNLKIGEKTIKPVFDFISFFEKYFGKTLVDALFENYQELKETLVYAYIYEFYDEIEKEEKSIIFAISSAFELYEISFENLTIESLDITFAGYPIVFENNSKYYFYSENDMMICFDKNDSFLSISNFVELIDFVDFQDKTFFTVKSEPNKVFYSEKIDIEEIDDSLPYDSVSLSISDGKILKLIKFKGSLYIIQQYAVSKLSGTEKKYYLNSNCNISSKIFANTISKVNDYIIFYTSSGLYLFDGNEIKHIYAETTNSFLVPEVVKGVVFNNKYYLLTDVSLCGNAKKCLVEFDVYSMKSCIYYFDGIEDIYIHTSPNFYELMVVENIDDEYKLLNIDYTSFISENKYLKFNDICFDDANFKNISYFKVIGSGEFDLKIVSDSMEKSFHITNNTELDNLGISGYMFHFEITSKKYFEIKSFLISVESISR